MADHFDPMEHRIRQAQIAVAADWNSASVDQRIYALAGWFADKLKPNGRKNRAKTVVVNLGFPAFGGMGLYAAILRIVEAAQGGG